MLKFNKWIAAGCSAALLFTLPASMLAHSTGADQGLSGAPGDDTCLQCHGTGLNPSGGSLTITFPSGTTYTPGQTLHIKVTLSDPTAKRWGFELSPRISSSATSNKTNQGTIVVTDSTNTRLTEPDGTLSWITHTSKGTYAGTTKQASWTLDYTPPANATGNIDIYAAGNGANGNGGSDPGDHVYTAKATLTPGVATGPTPTISSGGIANAASFSTAVAPGSLFSIFGTNLATATTSASALPLPTNLSGTTVSVNGNLIPLIFVSAGQINAQLPYNLGSNSASIVVSVNGSASAAQTFTVTDGAPGIFTYGTNRAIVVNQDGGLNASDKAAKAGSVVVGYLTGSGALDNPVGDGVGAPSSPLSRVKGSVSATVGTQTAVIGFAGLTPGFVGLLQLNFTIPASLTPGDYPLVVTINGNASKPATISVSN